METTTNETPVDEGLSKLFDDYEKSHQKTTKKTKEEIFAQYFVPRRETEYIRILPPLDGINYAPLTYFHYIKVGNRYQKLFCPKGNDGTDCALCDVADKLNKLENSEENLAVKKKGWDKIKLTPEEEKIKAKVDKIYKEKKNWLVGKYYILRVVDKQLMKDGVKFWRFKFNKKREGVMDKFIPLFKQYPQFNKDVEGNGYNFTDLKFGADFIITTAQKVNPFNPNKTYLAVTTINTRGPLELKTEEPSTLERILADKRGWRDVYKKKNPPHITYEEFLKLIVENKAPYYDESDPKNKRWIYPGNPEFELKANTRSNNFTPAPEDDVDEDEITAASYTPEQVRQHVAVDVTATAPSSITAEALAETKTATKTPPPPVKVTKESMAGLPANFSIDDDDINKLPF